MADAGLNSGKSSENWSYVGLPPFLIKHFSEGACTVLHHVCGEKKN